MSTGTPAPPLTTTFTPPSSCLSLTFYDGPPYNEDRLGPSPSATECFPSNWKSDSTFFFSPGLCPYGYLTATTSLNLFATLTETVVDCCPSSFSWVPSAGVAYGGRCEKAYTDLASTRSNPEYSSTNLVSTATGTGPGYVVASLLQVRFQQTDLSILSPTDKGSTTVRETVTITAAAKGLSTGAKAGIGIGVPLAVLLLIAIGIGVLIMSKRKRLGAQAAYGVHGNRQGGETAEIIGELSGIGQKLELDGNTSGHHPLTTLELEGTGRNRNGTTISGV